MCWARPRRAGSSPMMTGGARIGSGSRSWLRAALPRRPPRRTSSASTSRATRHLRTRPAGSAERQRSCRVPPSGCGIFAQREKETAMPSMPQSLTYAVVAAIGITVLTAIVCAFAGPGNIVAALLLLAIALGIYWLMGRNLATVVTATDVAAATAILFVLCALGDLVTGYPYQGGLFLLAPVALGSAFVVLHPGADPVKLRLRGDR